MDFLTEGTTLWTMAILSFFLIMFASFLIFASRYKRCPSDMILVVYGRVGAGQSAQCIHGGGKFIIPLIQGYSYLSLVPITINIPLENALSTQNIRINVPSTFTVAISTDPATMNNAAERMLGLGRREIEEMSREIIFGQLRLTVASLTIEQINQDREMFLGAIRRNVEPELNKIGLYLINVNITDITDESDYIDNIGKKAAAEATATARIDVAAQEKTGAIGQAEALRERAIKVAENEAESQKGQKKAEADRRVFVQRQEAIAVIGEAEATRERTVRVAENVAESEKGKKKAEADQRIYVQEQESLAVQGENTAKAEIAAAEAELRVKEEEARQRSEVAKRQATVAIQKAEYAAESERMTADEIAKEEINLRKMEIAAEAVAEKTRREAKGEADAILLKYQAEADGLRKLLESKAAGYTALIESCHGDAKAASTLLMIEKIEEIVAKQVEAIKNVKIDKVTVWDSLGGGNGSGGSSTADFLSNMVHSLPPLQEIAKMAGVELPSYLGRMVDTPTGGDGAAGSAFPVDNGGSSDAGPRAT